MKTTALTIVVPAEIVALSDLSLAERIALSVIAESPACSNASLAKLLGISIRGVEQMLRRLRESGLLQQVGNGRARVHRLMFPVERHTKCEEVENAKCHINSGENEIVESHNSCRPDETPADPDHPAPAPTQSVSPEMLQAKSVDDEIQCAAECLGCADFEGALRHCRSAKERVEAFPEAMREVKAEALVLVTEHESRVLALGVVFQHASATNMPRSKLNALFAAIKGLSAERLTQLRPALDAQARLGTPVDISPLLAD